MGFERGSFPFIVACTSTWGNATYRSFSKSFSDHSNEFPSWQILRLSSLQEPWKLWLNLHSGERQKKNWRHKGRCHFPGWRKNCPLEKKHLGVISQSWRETILSNFFRTESIIGRYFFLPRFEPRKRKKNRKIASSRNFARASKTFPVIFFSSKSFRTEFVRSELADEMLNGPQLDIETTDGVSCWIQGPGSF